jgi:hypothetical protein
MTAADFVERALERERPFLSRESLRYAAQQFVNEGRTDDVHLEHCVRLAEMLEGYAAAERPASRPAQVWDVGLTPGALLSSRLLLSKIQPQVEEVRRALFGSTKPPFVTYAEAVTWLEERAQAPAVPDGNGQPEADRAREVVGHIRALHRLLPGGDVVLQRRFIPYARPGEAWEHAIPIREEGTLAQLEAESSRLAQATGFSQAAVLAYVLADLRPVRPLARVRSEVNEFSPLTGEPIKRAQVTVTFLARDMTHTQLRDLYREIRQHLSMVKVKSISEKDRQLLALVEQHGGEPPHGKTAFWEWVRHEWNMAGQGKAGFKPYKDWYGPM